MSISTLSASSSSSSSYSSSSSAASSPSMESDKKNILEGLQVLLYDIEKKQFLDEVDYYMFSTLLDKIPSSVDIRDLIDLLEEAAVKKCNPAIHLILEKINNTGSSLLHSAVIENRLEVVIWILKRFNKKQNHYGINVPHLLNHVCGFHRETALHIACRNGNSKIVHQLLKAMHQTGASTNNLHNASGLTPLYLAVLSENPETVETFLDSLNESERAEVINCRNGESRATALHAACAIDNQKIIKLLLEYGASKEIPDREGRVPFLQIKPSSIDEDETVLVESIEQLHLSKKSSLSNRKRSSREEEKAESIIKHQRNLITEAALETQDFEAINMYPQL